MTTKVCPRDSNQLAPTPDALGPGTTVLECVRCAGQLIEWESAQALFKSLGHDVRDLQTLVKQAEAKPHRTAPLPCTACGKGPMKPFSFKGTELDLCEACGAVWLDRGELNRITKGKLGANAPIAPKAVAGVDEKVVGVFEMLWDCSYCGAKENLGQTHRFCPKCGAAQDAGARYFPPEGKETAASAIYDGADRECPACKTPNGAKANNCRQCGSPLDGSQRVAMVADRVSGGRPPPPAPGAPPAGKRKLLPWILGAVAALSCGFCGLATFWNKDVAVEVQGHSWERSIDIERFAQQSESAWCDSKPMDAYDVSRSREQRSTKSIPDGQECSTRDVDRGNGTFERRKECHTKYKEEPVYDDRCSYHVNRWGKTRAEKASGNGLGPSWPVFMLHNTGNSLGSEREGSRHETYTLSLKGADGKSYSCTLPEAKWSSIPDGYKKTIKVGVILSNPDCSML